jgi:hypothetical protein
MKDIKNPVFIPSDSDYVYEVSNGHVIKTHRKLFSYEGKKAVLTGISTILLEAQLKTVSKIMSTSLYRVLHGC